MSEIAIISINTQKMKRLAEEGSKAAGRLISITDSPSDFLATIQVGVTLSGFLNSAVAADNFAGDNLVANVLGGNDQDNGYHRQDGIDVKLRQLEMRQRQHPRLVHLRKINDPQHGGKHITRDNRNQHGNHAKKAAEQEAAYHAILCCRKKP